MEKEYRQVPGIDIGCDWLNRFLFQNPDWIIMEHPMHEDVLLLRIKYCNICRIRRASELIWMNRTSALLRPAGHVSQSHNYRV